MSLGVLCLPKGGLSGLVCITEAQVGVLVLECSPVSHCATVPDCSAVPFELVW